MKAVFALLLSGIVFSTLTEASLGFGAPRRRAAYAIDPCQPASWWAPAYAPGAAGMPSPAGSRLPSPYVRDYAAPTPAPPSSRPDEPGPRAPSVIESRTKPPEPGPSPSSPPSASPSPPSPPSPLPKPPAPPEPGPAKDYEAFYLAPGADGVRQASLAEKPVSFWNLSDRTLILYVGDRGHRLGRGGQLNLNVPRRFMWRVERRENVTTEISEGRAGMEIVIRR